MKVYIAAAYSKGDVAANVSKAIAVWHELADLKFIPFCPHLSHFLHLQRQRPYEEWLAFDLEWLRHCDVILRLPGESHGADLEVVEAQLLKIPVVHSVEALCKLREYDS